MTKKLKVNTSSLILPTISNSEILEGLAELVEVGFAQGLDDGLIQDIPFFGTLLKLGNTGANIRNSLLTRKLKKFLDAFEKVTPEDKAKFKKRMEQNPDFARKTGERLILLLEQLDDFDKPEIVGKIFKAFLEDKIDEPTFFRLGNAIMQAYIDDLKELLNIR